MAYTIDEIRAIAEIVARSRLYDGLTTDRAAVLMLLAQGLGLDAVAGLDAIVIDRGRPAITPRAAMALIQRAGVLDAFRLTRLAGPDGAFVGYRCFMRRGVVEFEASFTLGDAERAGLLANPAWRNYPENMCRWRAIGFVADVVCADLLLGSGRPLTIAADPLAAAIHDHGPERVARALAEAETEDAALADLDNDLFADVDASG